MADGTDCPGKDKEIGRGDGSARLSGYVTSEDVDAGRYKPLRAGVSLQYANREPRFYASVAFNGSVWNMSSLNGKMELPVLTSKSGIIVGLPKDTMAAIVYLQVSVSKNM